MYYVSTGDSIQQGSRLRPVRQVENIGEIEIKGFEIKITLDLLSNLSAYLNYNYNESVITEFDPLYSDQSEDITGMYLTYVPKNQLSAGMGWRNRVVNAGMALNHIGSYFSDDLNSTVIDPFTTLDVRLWRSFDKIGVKLDIENILNRVDLVDDGTINFGRFTRLELSWSF
jgi:outer membrane receptor protein involved in Fe transport